MSKKDQGFYEAFIEKLYTIAQDEGYPEIINELDDYYDCRNCVHYKHTRKICRLAQLGQTCNYEPFEKIQIPPSPATKRAEVKSRW